MYIDMSHRVGRWEDVNETLAQVDSHYVYPTTRDYGYGQSEIEIYKLDVPSRTLKVHIGANRAVCRAMGWVFQPPRKEVVPMLVSPDQMKLLEETLKEVTDALDPAMKKGCVERRRLRVLKEVVEAECRRIYSLEDSN